MILMLANRDSFTTLEATVSCYRDYSYHRDGTRSLLATVDAKSAAVLGQTIPHHTSVAFVEFIGEIVTTQRKARHIHVTADNLSTLQVQRD